MPITSPQLAPQSAEYISSFQGPLISAPPQDPKYLTVNFSFRANGNEDEATLDQVMQDLVDWIDSSPNYSCSGLDKVYPVSQQITPTP